jgi:hypothetical protein
MRHAIIAAVGLIAFSAAAFAQTDDKAAFEAMCARVSTTDGVPAQAIAPFCSCLATRAVANDKALYRELWTAAETHSNPDARMAALSPAGREAVQACRAPPPAN